jgi:Carboxypeptidase regulatory-like domain
MRNVGRSVAGVLTLMLLFSCGSIHAQQVSGAITGYVTDPGGGAVSGAQVTVTDVLTGVVTKTTTDSSGLYATRNLIPGQYSVGVVAQGFRAFVRENVILNVDSVISVDAVLTLGAVSDTVTVTDAPPLLNTQKTDVSATLSAEDVSSLPTIGRNITSLEVLAPGVIQYNYQQGVSENPGNGFTANANGQF